MHLLFVLMFDLNYVGFKLLEKDVVPLMEKWFDLNYVGFKYEHLKQAMQEELGLIWTMWDLNGNPNEMPPELYEVWSELCGI